MTRQALLINCTENKGWNFIMKVTELKNQLNTMEKNELIALIVKLYKNDKMCRNMLDAEFGGEEVQAVLLANAKKQLYDIFFSKASLSLRNAKAVLSGFKKTAKNKEDYFDLELYYVELGTAYTNEYGDINEAFYSSLISVFADFCENVKQSGGSDFLHSVRMRLDRLNEEAQDIGWGYGYEIGELYSELIGFYGEENE